jgi:Flp pilus assembly protein TadG
MAGPASMYRRFAASTRGVAAIEFAMILPILTLLFLASFDGGRAIAIYMKVRSATYTLGAITNQYSTIHDTDIQSILGATSVVLAPYSSSPVVVVVSELSISAGSQTTATVVWSNTLTGTTVTYTGLAIGSSVTLPTGLAAAGNTCGTYPCYLIYGKVSYTYTPMFGYFGNGGITLSDSLYVTPRTTTSITRTSP